MEAGLYMYLPHGDHRYGIYTIGDPILYSQLKNIFYSKELTGYIQGDRKEENWLYIEFIGMKLDDDSALKLCEEIANELGQKLKIDI